MATPRLITKDERCTTLITELVSPEGNGSLTRIVSLKMSTRSVVYQRQERLRDPYINSLPFVCVTDIKDGTYRLVMVTIYLIYP